MKTIEVVAAIIVRAGEVFATQRGYGEWQGWWEFPGGKIEAGETPQEALRREIREELDADIKEARFNGYADATVTVTIYDAEGQALASGSGKPTFFAQ